MSIFDSLRKTPDVGIPARSEPKTTEKTAKREEIVFAALPESLEEMKALPEASLTSPFQTAALTVCAFCAYAAVPDIGIQMLNFLKGPQELSIYDKQFIKDRLEDKKYLPFSYFQGAFPENDYTPSRPYTVVVETNAYSYADDGYVKLYLQSNGADLLRSVTARKKGNQWFLWDQMILADIRKPKSLNPWE